MLRVSRLRFASRVRGFSFNDDVRHFFEAQDEIFVVEQNCVGRMRVLLVNEPDSEPKKLKRALHYNGWPITARIISETIAARIPVTQWPCRVGGNKNMTFLPKPKLHHPALAPNTRGFTGRD
jgi:hypothetical protein